MDQPDARNTLLSDAIAASILERVWNEIQKDPARVQLLVDSVMLGVRPALEKRLVDEVYNRVDTYKMGQDASADPELRKAILAEVRIRLLDPGRLAAMVDKVVADARITVPDKPRY